MKRWTPLITAALIAYALWADFTFRDHGAWHPRHVVGLAIILPAYFLWAAARHQLGDSFTTRAEARVLVTTGVYARIRHPIYLSAELLTVGLVVFMGTPLLWLLSLIVLPWQIRRARREERVLSDAFGERYRTYRERTWL